LRAAGCRKGLSHTQMQLSSILRRSRTQSRDQGDGGTFPVGIGCTRPRGRSRQPRQNLRCPLRHRRRHRSCRLLRHRPRRHRTYRPPHYPLSPRSCLHCLQRRSYQLSHRCLPCRHLRHRRARSRRGLSRRCFQRCRLRPQFLGHRHQSMRRTGLTPDPNRPPPLIAFSFLIPLRQPAALKGYPSSKRQAAARRNPAHFAFRFKALSWREQPMAR
jgi:hypothetical protein